MKQIFAIIAFLASWHLFAISLEATLEKEIPMKIAVGTTNVVKVEAVKETIGEYPHLAHAAIVSIAAASEISEQPMSLEEIITGAKNRARNAYSSCEGCDYSFGIESGLFPAIGTQSGYLEACICVIYDGSNYHTGLSCGFEIPTEILKLITEKKRDLSEACYEFGITTNAKLGAAEGLIGILTKGRVVRKEYTKQCIRTALIQIENSNLYH